ncbi:unnamed protein product [Pipistrellus nathusii]|uniref:Uncharacterized protein n=1 Tax=Pipistrellus nathusii TaxID=59473 RepID=A0ABN9ZE23_PIPNA
MQESADGLKDLMPTERKSMWRTADERRMSDLTRVMEWLERRRGRKGPSLQPKLSRPEDAASYRRLYGVEPKGKRLSIVPGSYTKESLGKTELEMKDSLTSEPPRLMSFHHQSMTDPTLQDTLFGARKSTLLREWVGKLPDSAYERRIRSLMEKGVEPKVEMVRTLKPEEVLSCRYLRLSKNNIRTLLKLCTDVGMAVDIHPHMVESEIDAKKVFAPYPTVSL